MPDFISISPKDFRARLPSPLCPAQTRLYRGLCSIQRKGVTVMLGSVNFEVPKGFWAYPADWKLKAEAL